jgi:hypothetical protein
LKDRCNRDFLKYLPTDDEWRELEIYIKILRVCLDCIFLVELPLMYYAGPACLPAEAIFREDADFVYGYAII